MLTGSQHTLGAQLFFVFVAEAAIVSGEAAVEGQSPYCLSTAS